MYRSSSGISQFKPVLRLTAIISTDSPSDADTGVDPFQNLSLLLARTLPPLECFKTVFITK